MKAALVLDNGGFNLKAGFAGDDFPTIISRNVIADVRHKLLANADHLFGVEALTKRGIAKVRVGPIVGGYIVDWDGMEKVWKNLFVDNMRVNFEEHPLILSDGARATRPMKEKMGQILFETFGVPQLNFTPSVVLALYSYGYTSGFVTDAGHTQCTFAGVHEGKLVEDMLVASEFGGSSIDDYIFKDLSERMDVHSRYMDTIREFKESSCYVCHDENIYDHVDLWNDSNDVVHTAPDGTMILFKSERIRGPEVLFNNTFLSRSSAIPEFLDNSMVGRSYKVDPTVKSLVLRNVVLSGGSTLFPGFEKRIKVQLDRILRSNKYKLSATPDRIYAPWKGGSVLANLDCFDKLCTSKRDYDEIGPKAI
eukprot:TRINITY_DN10330_c0_g1_i1.p1 TRINITY_DN10330_c0_g1~~TRINITY_DN10330_c0_g1_i1.p1  ORF type:complete len:365 (-),score=24.15 TRINITY_DN10330_c0_g1_i1:74-1168(-)